ncbi:MAG TPA: lyase family protein [Gaiellaceae bacterium]|nr:lyase family protein [Gaiellaceae bacterium]
MTFDALFVPDTLREAVSDEAWLAGMLEAERALAAARGIQLDADDIDVSELVEEARNAGNPAEPLARRLRVRSPDAHRGATSQDILDTAAALVARNATRLIDEELDGVAASCARLADEHRTTVMAGRTLLQQAVPITFGLKAASWLVGVVHARERLRAAKLPAQLGGAAGTLAALGDKGIDVLHEYASRLELPEPVVPWHTRRLPVAELGAALSVAAGFVGKIALDLVLSAQTEVGEVRERDGGVSSTMPHKRNPIGATLARACALRAQAEAGILMTALVQEHERAAGAWHAEWGALSDALAYTGGAAASLGRALDGLEVDVERMRENVRDETLSEAKGDATRPEDYLGSAAVFVDRALEFYRRA